MPKASVLQPNFNAGELSPLVYGRLDSPRYKQGLATCLNYIPTLQGPIVRRPGTKYVNNVKDSTKPPILVPFQFSETQAYILEFGDKYIRFYANGGQILATGTTWKVVGELIANIGFTFTGTQGDLSPPSGYAINSQTSVSPGAILEVVTPYAYTDLPLLRWCQSADTLYLFHPAYQTMKLQRHAQTYWSLKQIYFQDGPYLPLNSYSTLGDSTLVTLTPSGTTGQITLSAGPIFNVSGVASDGGLIEVTTSASHGHAVGDNVYIKGVTGTVGANTNNSRFNSGATPNYWTIAKVNSATTMTLAGSTFAGAYVSGGTVAPALFTDIGPTGSNDPEVARSVALIMGGSRFWGTVFTSLDTSSLSFFVDPSNVLPGTTAATAWAIGVWSIKNGYPACGCFHQNRLMLAGAPGYPQEVEGSATGNFENFAISAAATLAVTAANALQENLVSSDVNVIHWMKSTAQGLCAGTYTAEWAMAPSSQGDALTPTNFNAIQTSSYGSAQAEAVQQGNAVISIQRALRKVREMNFFFQVGTFRSTDLSEISEHITLPTITKLVTQKQPQPLTWGIRSDGNLVSLTYDRDDVTLKSGWARYQLGGQSDAGGTNPIVQSMAVIPSTDLSFDQLWMTVKRYINGSTIIAVEYLTKIFDDSMLQEDAYHFDCGATYDTPLAITAITSANPAVVTSAAHGLSNGQSVKIVSVLGLNKSITDADGNVTITNLVNEQTFVVAGVTTNTFQLNDFNSNTIDSTGYSAYVSGGQARKLITTISGLTWLENETVNILADGAIHPSAVVSNAGVLTLSYPAAKVQIGYGYNSDGQLLRPDAGSADGSSIGQTRRVFKVAVMLHRVGDFLMGMNFSKLLPVSFQRADAQLADQATPLFSGIHRDGVESDYDFEGQFCFRQGSGLPGMIQAVDLFMDETDI